MAHLGPRQRAVDPIECQVCFRSAIDCLCRHGLLGHHPGERSDKICHTGFAAKGRAGVLGFSALSPGSLGLRPIPARWEVPAKLKLIDRPPLTSQHANIGAEQFDLALGGLGAPLGLVEAGLEVANHGFGCADHRFGCEMCRFAPAVQWANDEAFASFAFGRLGIYLKAAFAWGLDPIIAHASPRTASTRG
jgi:hypothetical protein